MNDRQGKHVYTILIVDDDRSVLEVLTRLLAPLAHNLIATESPIEAASLLRAHEVALLICDLHITSSDDGTDVLSTARTVNPNTVSILMSGNINSKAMITALNEGGIWKCLQKPMNLDQVIRLVEEGVARYARLKEPQDRLSAIARTVAEESKADTIAVSSSVTGTVAPIDTKITKQEKKSVGNRYHLTALLGEGGIGKVYAAEDVLLGTKLAIKVLDPDLSWDEDAIATLKEEARIAMGLSHRNIVRLYNFEKVGRTHFLVMEFVNGCSLRDILIHDKTLSVDSVRFIAKSCSVGFSFAHHAGVVHSDLKPENLMISQQGVLKIIDFGVACLIHTPKESKYITGTPAYMSPEQKKGKKVDLRTDVYSLGIILYEALTGRTPFPDDVSHVAILKMNPEKLTGLPDGLTRVLERAIAIDKADRWPAIRLFVDAFAEELVGLR